jgi:hypothetical protein
MGGIAVFPGLAFIPELTPGSHTLAEAEAQSTPHVLPGLGGVSRVVQWDRPPPGPAFRGKKDEPKPLRSTGKRPWENFRGFPHFFHWAPTEFYGFKKWFLCQRFQRYVALESHASGGSCEPSRPFFFPAGHSEPVASDRSRPRLVATKPSGEAGSPYLTGLTANMAPGRMAAFGAMHSLFKPYHIFNK